jgi:hypothetical protein
LSTDDRNTFKILLSRDSEAVTGGKEEEEDGEAYD